ncbi:hypothetical protein SUGI_1424080 [Cryptomeria japonica]|uniref:SKP1 component POZ domain-containing protein n=1 Tax=Cryptomeria japonica TaxID=3369 RepID=A0AAD3NQY9_CRYJA|nr:hypothetical protein SUGI_1424080 [Cryptomeria japonica]
MFYLTRYQFTSLITFVFRSAINSEVAFNSVKNKMAANIITLRLCKGTEGFEDFQVVKMVAMESEVIKNCIQHTHIWREPLRLTLPSGHVKPGKVLKKVLEYCEYHAHAKSNSISEEDVNIWDKEFAQNIITADKNRASVYDIVKAADFLIIDGLLNLLCITIVTLLHRGGF